VVKTESLVEVLEFLYASFPEVERVTSYGRAKTLVQKPLEDLQRIRKAGLTRLHVGLETGDPELLKEINKGATPDEMVEGGRKAKQAGFEYSLYVLLGAGGEDRWEQHARGTAAVLNQIDPHFIRVRTLIPQPHCPMYEEMIEGRFRLSSPETILKETRLLLAELKVNSEFMSDHVSNLLPLHGRLPGATESMVRMIDEALQDLKEDDRLRREMEARRHLTNL
jgi:radical SAM superfamily enzyme YgiQ (UPF0313 family)